MTVLVLASSAFAFVATIAAATFAVVRALNAWRTLRSVQRVVGAGLSEVTRRVATSESRMTHAAENAARLQRATGDLQESLRIASLLSRSVADARATLSWRSLLRQ